LEGISDLRHESDRHGIRVVIELKQASLPQVILNNLYQKTKLQTTFSGNFCGTLESNNSNKINAESITTLTPMTPQRFTLRQALDYFLDFRFSTIRRKNRHQFQKIQGRMHIVEGLLLALLL
jgi:DNA gyrase subunit A